MTTLEAFTWFAVILGLLFLGIALLGWPRDD